MTVIVIIQFFHSKFINVSLLWSYHVSCDCRIVLDKLIQHIYKQANLGKSWQCFADLGKSGQILANLGIWRILDCIWCVHLCNMISDAHRKARPDKVRCDGILAGPCQGLPCQRQARRGPARLYLVGPCRVWAACGVLLANWQFSPTRSGKIVSCRVLSGLSCLLIILGELRPDEVLQDGILPGLVGLEMPAEYSWRT